MLELTKDFLDGLRSDIEAGRDVELAATIGERVLVVHGGLPRDRAASVASADYIDRAAPATELDSPNVLRMAFIGIFLGLALGVLLAIVREPHAARQGGPQGGVRSRESRRARVPRRVLPQAHARGVGAVHVRRLRVAGP